MRFEFSNNGMAVMTMIAEDEYDFILLWQRYGYGHCEFVHLALPEPAGNFNGDYRNEEG